jgi:hypothetical protein
MIITLTGQATLEDIFQEAQIIKDFKIKTYVTPGIGYE